MAHYTSVGSVAERVLNTFRRQFEHKVYALSISCELIMQHSMEVVHFYEGEK